ncbi:MAG TPA: hypothetical protein VMU65_15765 [Candidatus Saccharimonadales bacterium]|nr:hypothetical protein [Candidatus Saccharimonadales bacterium]
MPSQPKGARGETQPLNRAARILSLIDVPVTTALFLLIFVIPTYSTSSATTNSESGITIWTDGAATIFASNPGASAIIAAVTALAGAALVLTLITAWLGTRKARWPLAAVLVPLTALAILGMFSIGVFVAPPVALGWAVFRLCRPRHIAELDLIAPNAS